MHGTEDARDVYGFCPGPRHLHHAYSVEEDESGEGLFVEHAEERFEWVTSLAGCQLGGAVPVLWRGCSAGCLDFLEAEDAPATHLGPGEAIVGAGKKERDEDEEFIGMFDVAVRGREEEKEEAMVEAQTQIIWDDMMDLDD
jgi:hypothetical protein